MTNYEAKLILGIEDNKILTKSDLNKAFAKQISINHPDKNGSRYLT